MRGSARKRSAKRRAKSSAAIDQVRDATPAQRPQSCVDGEASRAAGRLWHPVEAFTRFVGERTRYAADVLIAAWCAVGCIVNTRPSRTAR